MAEEDISVLLDEKRVFKPKQENINKTNVKQWMDNQGIKTLDCRTGSEEILECRFLILATGGAGQLYKFNTNSAIATGDGIALAFKAGAEISDMEFFQFHPTALRLPGVTPFLVSEAVRGEGGVLRNVNGECFMQNYTPDGDLAGIYRG